MQPGEALSLFFSIISRLVHTPHPPNPPVSTLCIAAKKNEHVLCMRVSNAAWMSHTTLWNRHAHSYTIDCIWKKNAFVSMTHTLLFLVLQVVGEKLIQRLTDSHYTLEECPYPLRPGHSNKQVSLANANRPVSIQDANSVFLSMSPICRLSKPIDRFAFKRRFTLMKQTDWSNGCSDER